MKKNITDIIRGLLLAYLLTAVLLLLLAVLLYKAGISEAVVNAGVVVIYAVSVFVSGIYMGHKKGIRKYLWGMATGGLYFLILFIMTLVMGNGAAGEGRGMITTLIICLAGGMLGGMAG